MCRFQWWHSYFKWNTHSNQEDGQKKYDYKWLWIYTHFHWTIPKTNWYTVYTQSVFGFSEKLKNWETKIITIIIIETADINRFKFLSRCCLFFCVIFYSRVSFLNFHWNRCGYSWMMCVCGEENVFFCYHKRRENLFHRVHRRIHSKDIYVGYIPFYQLLTYSKTKHQQKHRKIFISL